jgi:hypothetical protein
MKNILLHMQSRHNMRRLKYISLLFYLFIFLFFWIFFVWGCYNTVCWSLQIVSKMENPKYAALDFSFFLYWCQISFFFTCFEILDLPVAGTIEKWDVSWPYSWDCALFSWFQQCEIEGTCYIYFLSAMVSPFLFYRVFTKSKHSRYKDNH